MICPKCGSNMEDGSVFCAICGSNLSEGSSNMQTAGSVDPNVQMAVAPTTQNVDPEAAKRLKKKIIIGISIFVALCIVAVVIFSIVDGKKGIRRTWYSVDDPDEYIVIKSDTIYYYEDGELEDRFSYTTSGDNMTIIGPYGGTTIKYEMKNGRLYLYNGSYVEVYMDSKPSDFDDYDVDYSL